jgi:zinc protease
MIVGRAPGSGAARLDVQVAERRLPSGLTLIAVHNPGVRTFAAVVALRVSLVCEEPGEEGIASLVGSCLDEGTKRRDAEAFAVAAELLGATLEGNPDGGVLQCPASEAKKGLALLREMVCEPSFPDREVRRVQQETLVQMRNDAADASTVAGRLFRKGVYGRHRLARPGYGTAERVESFRPIDLRRFHERWFVPEQGVVAAAGPGSPEETLDLLARTFSSFRGALPTLPTQPKPPALRAATAVRRMAREQVHVYLGHLGVKRVCPDYHELLVMDHVLGAGAGFTSRIAQRLRDEQGLCYSVHASITSSAGREPGAFTAYIGTSPASRDAAIAGFREEIQKLQNAPPTPDEIAEAHSYLTGSYAFSLQRSLGLARYALACQRFDLGFDYAEKRNDLVRAVCAEDVQRVARQYLDADRVVIAWAGPS